MKIAVASADGVSISQHFGRSQCFIVFDVADGKATTHEVRDNTYTAHAKGECKGGEHHHDQPHSHADIVAALHDCQVVLCGGMGWRAAEELQANGIRPIMVDAATTPEQAVQDLLGGKLKPTTGFCRCHQ
jgi:predicted Fe-Mo cluster-binding NifX family protein